MLSMEVIAVDVGLSIAGLFLLAGGAVAIGRGETKSGLLLLAVALLVEAASLGDLAATQRGLDLSGLIVSDLLTILDEGVVARALPGGLIMLTLIVNMILCGSSLLIPSKEQRVKQISIC